MRVVGCIFGPHESGHRLTGPLGIIETKSKCLNKLQYYKVRLISTRPPDRCKVALSRYYNTLCIILYYYISGQAFRVGACL